MPDYTLIKSEDEFVKFTVDRFGPEMALHEIVDTSKIQYPILVEVMPPSLRIMDITDLAAIAKIMEADRGRQDDN